MGSYLLFTCCSHATVSPHVQEIFAACQEKQWALEGVNFFPFFGGMLKVCKATCFDRMNSRTNRLKHWKLPNTDPPQHHCPCDFSSWIYTCMVFQSGRRLAKHQTSQTAFQSTWGLPFWHSLVSCDFQSVSSLAIECQSPSNQMTGAHWPVATHLNDWNFVIDTKQIWYALFP